LNPPPASWADRSRISQPLERAISNYLTSAGELTRSLERPAARRAINDGITTGTEGMKTSLVTREMIAHNTSPDIKLQM
jgi:dihydroxyacid dehydratase/phosphogluconate dehydratase